MIHGKGYRFLIITGAALLCLCLACSEERKREAAQLEQELRAQLDSSRDTVSGETGDTAHEPIDLLRYRSSLRSDTHGVAPDTASTETAAASAELQPLMPDNAAAEPSRVPELLEDQTSPVLETPYTAGPYYTIQVESWESAQFAAQQAEKYRADGFDAYISANPVNGQERLRVRIGKFATRAEAERVLADLSARYGLQPWIDHVK